MDSIWSKLRHHSKPSGKFRENLRADLFEKITKKDENFFIKYIENVKIPESKLVLKIERDWSFSSLFSEFTSSISRFFADINRSLLKGVAFLGTGVAASLLILPLFSVVTVPNSLALEPSILRSISGDLDIIRSNSAFDPVEYQELYEFDIIKTGKDSASEIVFFDGSILRLAEDTEIKIVKIKPHSLLFSTGEVEIMLLHGNVWLKTFKDSTLSENDAFVLHTPSFEIIPNKSTLSVHYQGGKEWIYALENSAIVGVNGINVDDNIDLKKSEMLQFSIFDEFTPLNEVIPGSFYDSEWVVSNIAKDISYTAEYLDTISDKMQEKYIMSALSSQVEEFLQSNPTDEELSLFITDINSLMLVLDASHKKEEIPEVSVTPEPTAVPVSNVRRTYSNYRSLQKSQNRNTTNNTSEDFTIEQENSNSQNKSRISTNEDKIIDVPVKLTARQIAEKRRAIQKEKRINSAVHSFSQQIDAFKFANSRETTALNILDKISETEDNLELLKRIEMTAPADVKKIVEKKRQEIEKKFPTESNTIENNTTTNNVHNTPLDIETIKPLEMLEN